MNHFDSNQDYPKPRLFGYEGTNENSESSNFETEQGDEIMPLLKKDLRFYESIFHFLHKFYTKTIKDAFNHLGFKKISDKKKSYHIKKEFDLEFDESASDIGRNKMNIMVTKKKFESEEEKFKSEREKNQDHQIKDLKEIVENMQLKI